MAPTVGHSDHTRVRVAALQFEPVHGDVDGNLARAREILLSIQGPRPEIVVFPEMALTGYIWSGVDEIMPHAVACSDPATHRRWIDLASECGSWLVIGHPAVDPVSGLLTNRCTLVSPTQVVGHYDKTCLFVEDLSWATAGTEIPPLWDTPIGRVAPLICADLDYPEPIESAVARGARAIVFSTAWVAEPAPSATWTLRAAEYGVPLIAADLIGTDQGIVFSGGSCIVDASGLVLASNDYDSGVVSAEISLNSTSVSANPRGQNPNIHVHRLHHADSAETPSSVTISVWTGDSADIPPVPRSAGNSPHLVVLPTTRESRDTWLANIRAYASRHSALVVQGRQVGPSTSAEILIVTPGSEFFSFTGSQAVPTATLLDFAGIQIGIMPNSEFASHSVSRALSVLGASVILGQGGHTLQPPRGSAATRAPFLSGLGDADPTFGHPIRFRAGDANVWLAFCSETESVPSGIFSPDHVSWPRHESLTRHAEWITQNCSLDPADPWGKQATTKPLLSSRNLSLYDDSFRTTVSVDQWSTSLSVE